VAIALAMHHRVPLASLTVLEAPVVELLRHREADQHHYRDFRAMTDQYFAAFAGGDAEAIGADDRFLRRTRDVRFVAAAR